MKKFPIFLVIVMLIAVSLPILANPSASNTCGCRTTRRAVVRRKTNTQVHRNYATSSAQTRQTYARPNWYARHRNLTNILIGTGAGAITGGVVKGNRKGMAYGAAAGAGAGALYTFVLRPKRKNY